MSLFLFEGSRIASNNKRLPGLSNAKKLAFLFQAPVYIQEVILAFGINNAYSIKNTKVGSYKEKDSLVDWMQNNMVIIDDGNEVNGCNLYTHFRERDGEVVVLRNDELKEFFEELHQISKKYSKDLMWIPHKNSALLFTYWLTNGKPSEMKLTLTDFHEILDLNPSLYYSYQQLEKRLVVVKNVMDECGYEFTYQKDDPKYGHSELIAFKKR